MGRTDTKCDVGTKYASCYCSETTGHHSVQLGLGHIFEKWADQERCFRLFGEETKTLFASFEVHIDLNVLSYNEIKSSPSSIDPFTWLFEQSRTRYKLRTSAMYATCRQRRPYMGTAPAHWLFRQHDGFIVLLLEIWRKEICLFVIKMVAYRKMRSCLKHLGWFEKYFLFNNMGMIFYNTIFLLPSLTKEKWEKRQRTSPPNY